VLKIYYYNVAAVIDRQSNRLWCNNKIVVCSFWFYNQNDWRSL